MGSNKEPRGPSKHIFDANSMGRFIVIKPFERQ
jgi:hypothetical protein